MSISNEKLFNKNNYKQLNNIFLSFAKIITDNLFFIQFYKARRQIVQKDKKES